MAQEFTDGVLTAFATTVNDASTYVDADEIIINGRRTTLRIAASGAALTNVKISSQLTAGATSVSLGENTDLNSASVVFRSAFPAVGAAGSAIGSGTTVEIDIDANVEALVVSAKGTGATMTISGYQQVEQ